MFSARLALREDNSTPWNQAVGLMSRAIPCRRGVRDLGTTAAFTFLPISQRTLLSGALNGFGFNGLTVFPARLALQENDFAPWN